ncbi:CheF family chemotaxis protein [Haloarculaceae archaeon H-GB2-1]|nr:CheF family chemotaxis protein [Haloarculaceae archaeon H-GB11]MEA5407318.1 CheF family chemotaxis protein [Haloarculaceae archaeon H-GB2-1]
MSESVIADFVAKFNSEATSQVDPVKGRILLSQKRLVLAASARDDKLTIPLSKIFDIAVGHVPPDLGDFFNSTVTIAFDHKDRRIVAAVEASDEKIQKFSTVLFKAILNGTEMTIKHPARMGAASPTTRSRERGCFSSRKQSSSNERESRSRSNWHLSPTSSG